jgi:hypothetical protein
VPPAALHLRAAGQSYLLEEQGQSGCLLQQQARLAVRGLALVLRSLRSSSVQVEERQGVEGWWGSLVSHYQLVLVAGQRGVQPHKSGSGALLVVVAMVAAM